ncbi:hypothetical protein HMPREF1990_01644 [Porphyromonas gingivalis W4087]|nr:hypothetical protein HMPREF1990_01644 [Porphyromonas gingivalis W4087]
MLKASFYRHANGVKGSLQRNPKCSLRENKKGRFLPYGQV